MYFITNSNPKPLYHITDGQSSIICTNSEYPPVVFLFDLELVPASGWESSATI